MGSSTPVQLPIPAALKVWAISTRFKAVMVQSSGMISSTGLLKMHCLLTTSFTLALLPVHLMAPFMRCGHAMAPCSGTIPLLEPCTLHQSWMAVQSTSAQTMAWPMHYVLTMVSCNGITSQRYKGNSSLANAGCSNHHSAILNMRKLQRHDIHSCAGGVVGIITPLPRCPSRGSAELSA